MIRIPRRLPWWLAVGALAFGVRLAYLVLVDEPLLYHHQYNYFRGGLSIAEHPHPLAFIVHSDEWRTWDGLWTLAPLYFWFLAALFRFGGFHLFPIQLVQCALEAGVAVLVAGLGRRAAGPALGALAGFAYALYWPSVELPSRTMTENLHTVLLMAAMAALVRAAVPEADATEPPAGASVWASARRGGLAGVVFGLSALARAVGLAFLPLAILWTVLEARGRRGVAVAAGLVAGAAIVLLPWAGRNWWLIGDPSPIESVSVFNMWTDNSLSDEVRLERQRHYLADARDARERQALVWRFVARGLKERGAQYPAKVWESLRHFLRPDALWILLGAEQPWPAWHHAARLVFDDGLFFLSLPLFAAFLGAGRPAPLRRLVLLWTAYYLLMVVVVFHNEIRYRSALVPFLLVGAAGGLAVLRDRGSRRAYAPLVAGAAVSVACLLPYVAPAAAALRARWRLRSGSAALDRGDAAGVLSAAARAAEVAPPSARPWFTAGRWLAASGHDREALEAYRHGEPLVEYKWIPLGVMPRLLAASGAPEQAARAIAAANAASFEGDPWLLLETAWRELPPPRGTTIALAEGDFGAVRDFLHPLGDRRWTRGHAELRLVPPPAAAYAITLEMASPPPAPRGDPTVVVRVRGGTEARFTLSVEMRPYRLVTARPRDGVLEVRLEAPTWNRPTEPAEQGVQVSRLTVAAAE